MPCFRTRLRLLAQEAAQLLTAGQLRAVVAAGGDGTIRLIAEQTPPGTPLVVLPLGTENLLARYLELTGGAGGFGASRGGWADSAPRRGESGRQPVHADGGLWIRCRRGSPAASGADGAIFTICRMPNQSSMRFVNTTILSCGYGMRRLMRPTDAGADGGDHGPLGVCREFAPVRGRTEFFAAGFGHRSVCLMCVRSRKDRCGTG